MRRWALFATRRRIVAVAVGVGAIAASGGGLAEAAYSVHTTSAQRISAGTYRWQITGGGAPTAGPRALVPGTPPQAFTFHVEDSGSLREYFTRADLSARVTSHVPGCPSSDFSATIKTHGETGKTLSPGGAFAVTVSASLNTTLTTDACQGTSPTVTLTINSAD